MNWLASFRSMIIFAWCILGLIVTATFGQPYSVPWHTIDGGGGRSTFGAFELNGTIGQHDPGPTLSGNGFTVIGGYWVVAGGGGGSFTPDSFSTFRGVLVSGDLNSVLNSDNSDLCHNPGITLFPSEAPVTLDFVGTCPDDTPNSISVSIESSANTVGLGLTFRMWNFNTSSWQTVGTSGQTNNVDTVRTFAGTPANHVQAGTGQVRTRYEVRRVSFVFLFPWTDCIDHVFWTFD
jgi:hypothetical protein